MKLPVILLAVVLICGALLFLAPKWYLKDPKWQPSKEITDRLERSGDSALADSDVPVAALLLYGKQIIGTGYNTVRKDLLAGGHAEINAISAALKITGVDSFMKLDRDSIMLITTWEPCPMCEGAIEEYNIRHVVFFKCKSLMQYTKVWCKRLHYYSNRRKAADDTLQEHLFRKHPLYDQQNN